MAYPSLAANLLISAPSDIPADDLAVIRKAVSQWNVNYGRIVGVTVIPVSWTENAVSEFGDRPQAIINRQLVDFADFAVALFADRLGTPTGNSVSGTWEEVEELMKAGKPVSVLRSNCLRSHPTGTDAAAEKLRLEKHLSEVVFSRGLMLAYADHAQLSTHVLNMLTHFAGQLKQRMADDDENGTTEDRSDHDEAKGVWPRIEVTEHPETDSKGRFKTKRRWKLILANTTGGPVRNVRYQLDAGQGKRFSFRDEAEIVKLLAPSSEIGFPLSFSMGSASQANCIVTWEDADGEYQTEATVRR